MVPGEALDPHYIVSPGGNGEGLLWTVDVCPFPSFSNCLFYVFELKLRAGAQYSRGGRLTDFHARVFSERLLFIGLHSDLQPPVVLSSC